ncbi:LptA/OstA family protein [Ancylobacter terrae]|uniref:LptA/OstA family protein n=1 Tax=Ancylobacter sp. sgz301288 TaxID=3342077 RepID=UPI00385AA712
MMLRHALAIPAAALALSFGACLPALAQQNVPNALQGFARNRAQPIKIDANSLEVRDKDKAAIFSGNVVVQQGDTTMRCKELVVYYTTSSKGLGGDSGADADATKPDSAKPDATKPDPAKTAAAKPDANAKPTGNAFVAGSPVGSSAIRRLEANGGVIITTKEQTATGDQGIFETASNTITLVGKPVVLTSGPNVIRGQRLTVDLATGSSRFEGGRVESIIVPNSGKGGAGLPFGNNTPPAGGPGAKPAR